MSEDLEQAVFYLAKYIQTLRKELNVRSDEQRDCNPKPEQQHEFNNSRIELHETIRDALRPPFIIPSQSPKEPERYPKPWLRTDINYD